MSATSKTMAMNAGIRAHSLWLSVFESAVWVAFRERVPPPRLNVDGDKELADLSQIAAFRVTAIHNDAIGEMEPWLDAETEPTPELIGTALSVANGTAEEGDRHADTIREWSAATGLSTTQIHADLQRLSEAHARLNGALAELTEQAKTGEVTVLGRLAITPFDADLAAETMPIDVGVFQNSVLSWDGWARPDATTPLNDYLPTGIRGRHLDRQVERRHFSHVRLAGLEILEVWPAEEDQEQESYRTGAPGRPSSRQLVLDALEDRISKKQLSSKIADEARYLETWLKKEYPKAPRLKAGGIANVIRKIFNDSKPKSI